MQADNQRRARFRGKLAFGAAILALAAIDGGGAIAAPAPAQGDPTINIDIPQGNLPKSLTQLGRQARVQIVFLPDRVRGRRARALRGTFTVEQALDRLLDGSGLRYQKTAGGAYVVGGPTAATMDRARRVVQDLSAAQGIGADGQANVPEILVRGVREWTLNLDIPRTANDAQPYVVFTQKDIVRSGATSLEDFFHSFLGANNSPTLSTQNGLLKGQTSINLRGLGAENTLILVDGRRYAQANTGGGLFTQASVNGIPLDAIERIEVLASSASGIYGSNAVGGVINIIMRRSYHGLEATAYYGNTTRTDAFESRLSLNGSFPLEQGRTRVSFNASWQKTGGLYEGERDFTSRGRAQVFANAPSYLNTITQPVQGATPNIVSADGTNLILKSQYGGTSLGSRITYVPVGYRGLGQDGVAALIANAGRQNLDISQTPTSGALGDGALVPLILPTQSYNGSFTVRREFNKWLSLYGEFGYSRYETVNLNNPAAGTYTLPGTSSDNPFTNTILVSIPVTEGNRTIVNASTNLRALAGAIVKLPFDWQAAIDLTWNWNHFDAADGLPGFDVATTAGIKSGAVKLLRDAGGASPALTYLDRPSSGLIEPSHSYSRSYTLKLAGPLPWLRLWGGKPIATLLFEQDKQVQGQYVNFGNTAEQSSVSFTPARSQRADSVYGEVRFPIIGKDNHVPLIRQLELQVAGRYDNYVGVGSNTFLNCFPNNNTVWTAPLPASAYTTQCPQAGAQPVFATTRNSSVNPTVALRWAVSSDIAFRGSYSTGYLPPKLNAVVSASAGFPGSILAGKAIVNVTDPRRGNEQVGQSLFGIFQVLPAVQGGNPNIDPQTSKSWSVGTILTPRFISGLRISVDWSLIIQNNIYFQPESLLSAGTSPGGQQAFNDFLAAYPGRFPRDTNPATFGSFGVGPILSADVTTANLLRGRSEAVDFAVSYDTKLGKGVLSLQGAATWLRDLTFQNTPLAAPVNTAGVADNGFLSSFGGYGGLSWKGNGSILYTADRWSLGARARYFGAYWLNAAHTVVALQGAAKIPAQAYVDLYGSFKITPKTEFRAGVNNVFDHAPPINSTSPIFYSMYGDPRRANFYLSINRKF
ncbi:MAG TPA: TonB-dependent receptor [Sphingomonas sp.]|nr:TonB-dependent receptor [Sphingomonas sp.]